MPPEMVLVLIIIGASMFVNDLCKSKRVIATTSRTAPYIAWERQSIKNISFQFGFHFRCFLCEKSQYPACLPCGHVACWTCLIKNATTAFTDDLAPKCPFCRSKYRLSRVIPFLNLWDNLGKIFILFDVRDRNNALISILSSNYEYIVVC